MTRDWAEPSPFSVDTSRAPCCGHPWSDHDQYEVELDDGGVVVEATCPPAPAPPAHHQFAPCPMCGAEWKLNWLITGEPTAETALIDHEPDCAWVES